MTNTEFPTTGFLTRPVQLTQPEILQRLLDNLSQQTVVEADGTVLRPLQGLTTRDESDPSIALLDACAMSVDVLSFYQQQYNTETYMGTATQLESVRALARMVGYELSPGLAAQVLLAFNVDPSANQNTGLVTLPVGTQVQSLPAGGNPPQVFETSADFAANAAWNQLTPAQPTIPVPQAIYGNTVSVLLDGVSTGIKKGDTLLVTGYKNTQLSPDSFVNLPSSQPGDIPLTLVAATDAATPLTVSVKNNADGTFNLTFTHNPGSNQAVQTFSNLTVTGGPTSSRVDIALQQAATPWAFVQGKLPQAIPQATQQTVDYVNFTGGVSSSTPATVNLPVSSGMALTLQANTSNAAVTNAGNNLITIVTLNASGTNTFNLFLKDTVSGKNEYYIGLTFSTISSQLTNTSLATVQTASTSNPLATTQTLPFQLPFSSFAAFLLQIKQVVTDTKAGTTQVNWQSAWSSAANSLLNDISLDATDELVNPAFYLFTQQLSSFGSNAPLVGSLFSKTADGTPSYNNYYATGNDWDGLSQTTMSTGTGLTGSSIIPTLWQDSQATVLALDESNPPAALLRVTQPASAIAVGSWVMLSVTDIVNGELTPYQQLCRVTAVKEASAADFGITGKVSNLSVSDAYGNAFTPVMNFETSTDGPGNLPPGLFLFRQSAITMTAATALPLYVATENDTSVTYPLLSAEGVQSLPLNSLVPDIASGQTLIISSLPALMQETVTIKQIHTPIVVPGQPTTVTVTIANSLIYHYQPGTMLITLPTVNSANQTVSLDFIVSEYEVDSNTNTFELLINFTADEPVPAFSVISSPQAAPLSGRLQVEAESFMVDSVEPQSAGTVVQLQAFPTLQNTYSPFASVVYGNVVAATQGETVSGEVLGSGNHALVNQQFSLKRTPLTYVPDATSPTGVSSTLSVWVNHVEWTEVSLSDFYISGPSAPVYTVQQAENGEVTLTFGDGIQGARLPTGQENVIATYRTGLGSAGNVGIGALNLLKSKPAGVQSVTNPIAAGGGADAATVSESQTLAPVSTLTLNERLVSLSDFENFVAGYPGITKALAQLLMVDGYSVLYITVAGETADDNLTETLSTLQTAVRQVSGVAGSIQVNAFQGVTFSVKATLTLASAYSATQVHAAAVAALQSEYSFANQAIGESVSASAVIDVLQALPGVIGVELTVLGFGDNPSNGINIPAILFPELAVVNNNNGQVQAAHLLMIDENGIDIEIAS